MERMFCASRSSTPQEIVGGCSPSPRKDSEVSARIIAGTASVTDDCGTITLAAEGAGLLHLYAPDDPTILCLEPVSHLPDAANAGAMPLCAPGETVSLSLRIGVA